MAGWQETLDALEEYVARAEQLLEAGVLPDGLPEWASEWAPPALPPLPRELAPRARALAARQQAVLERASAVLTTTRHQLRVGRRIGQATARPVTPVYLDVTA